jgi:DNA-binding SARP family transcriptional activator
MLAFRILGPSEVLDHERPVPLGGPKQRALLTTLLLRRGGSGLERSLDRSALGRAPSGDDGQDAAGIRFASAEGAGDDVLLTRGGGYLLAAPPDQVDAGRFEAIPADARRALAVGDASGARKLLAEALGLWRGEPLADLGYEPFAQREIARLEEAAAGRPRGPNRR